MLGTAYKNNSFLSHSMKSRKRPEYSKKGSHLTSIASANNSIDAKSLGAIALKRIGTPVLRNQANGFLSKA